MIRGQTKPVEQEHRWIWKRITLNWKHDNQLCGKFDYLARRKKIGGDVLCEMKIYEDFKLTTIKRLSKVISKILPKAEKSYWWRVTVASTWLENVSYDVIFSAEI
jgi:hypothetical protein